MTASLRIVVADDEPDMRDYFRKILARLGHTVVAAAETGSELIVRCRVHRPELVITDIKMPELDGIDAVRTICGERPVPVILVSAYNDARRIEHVQEEAVRVYLVKPIRQADLESAIDLAVRRFEQTEVLRSDE